MVAIDTALSGNILLPVRCAETSRGRRRNIWWSNPSTGRYRVWVEYPDITRQEHTWLTRDVYDGPDADEADRLYCRLVTRYTAA